MASLGIVVLLPIAGVMLLVFPAWLGALPFKRVAAVLGLVTLVILATACESTGPSLTTSAPTATPSACAATG